jgi:uncharacterized protein
MKVAVTGATGFVGSRLVDRLQAEGHQVLVLTRNAESAKRMFPTEKYSNVEIIAYSPLTSGEWQQSIAGCDAVVNLAGAPIAESRWTAERKQEILESRKTGTRKIVEAIGFAAAARVAQANPKPSVLINSSAIGYYGTSETATFEESAKPGSDFLAQVCQDWETEAEQVKAAGVRLVILRTGIVLGMGGAIAKMLLPFRMFAGGPIGSGRQWFSWIHREDMVSLILFALTRPEMTGAYNATAPHPVKMAELCSALGQVMNRPSWLPVPDFALEALLGDGAQVVLQGQQVLPKRTEESGFQFAYPTVKPALEEVLSHS